MPPTAAQPVRSVPQPAPQARPMPQAAPPTPAPRPPVDPPSAPAPAFTPPPVPPAPAYPAAPTYAPEPPAPRTSTRGRRLLAAASLVVGLGLVGGAVAGAAITHTPDRPAPVADGSPQAFAQARDVWRDTPVDTLFPPTVDGKGGGPGGADRSWTRIGVAAPAGCTGAFDPLLTEVLAPAGCVRLLRATYVDSTSTTVTTVGLLVGSGQAAAMSALAERWSSQHLGERADLLPRPVAFPGTPAAAFGDRQRGSWDVRIAADLPFVVYAVSGFADGRTVAQPDPADKADAQGATTPSAQAGLGFDATGLAAAVDARVHTAVDALRHPQTTTGSEHHG